MEFQEFDKIARLFRDITITEKLDGTNGAIAISTDLSLRPHTDSGETVLNDLVECDGTYTIAPWYNPENGETVPVLVWAQSRSRCIYPGLDNHGFAKWVWENKQALVEVLGPGLHFGEWWGSGIQRGYGLPKGEKRFSLFNTKRWGWLANTEGLCTDTSESRYVAIPQGLGVVPVLYQGANSTLAVRMCLDKLDTFGSVAAPGFKPAEGVVVFHTAGNCMFKATIVGDDTPKSLIGKPRTILNDEVPKSVAEKQRVQPATMGLAA